MERPFARIFGKKEVPPVLKGTDDSGKELSDLIERREQLITAMEQDPHPDDRHLLIKIEEQIRARGGTI